MLPSKARRVSHKNIRKAQSSELRRNHTSRNPDDEVGIFTHYSILFQANQLIPDVMSENFASSTAALGLLIRNDVDNSTYPSTQGKGTAEPDNQRNTSAMQNLSSIVIFLKTVVALNLLRGLELLHMKWYCPRSKTDRILRMVSRAGPVQYHCDIVSELGSNPFLQGRHQAPSSNIDAFAVSFRFPGKVVWWKTSCK